ncbi:protein-disulfide isomerase [Candidatus Peregrinibacteria bacterium CG11_big_fil_rev_8_21_14_0_20_46_8]|nr:MAG: protein-disulfide isomerase [Candidatus Peregrinibacteria bacterium CG11_big_fil_rev_8_21_14_0_20_46_8]
MTEHLQGDGLTKREMKRQQKIYKQQKRERSAVLNKAIMWVVAILVVGVVVVGLAKLLGPAFTQTPLPDDFEVGTVLADDWVKGNRNAEVVLIEYADFQCPACASYFPIVQRLNAELGDKIAFVFRHFPLRSIHPNAEPSARAAEAAGRQGKFFEMHDMIFAKQHEWSRLPRAAGTFEDYAEELGLDMDQYEKDVNSQEVINRVNRDVLGGRAAGVNGTPTFFLNGQQITNPRSYDEFKALIESALQNS